MELFPVSHGVDFLGYRHFPDGYMLLRKSTAKRIRHKINDGLEEKPLEYQRSFLESTKGWARHANCYNFSKAVRLHERIAEVLIKAS
jgi:hypothetical protein